MKHRMRAYFVQDHKAKFKYFSEEPIEDIDVSFTRLKRIWELAKRKLMLLPKRVLAQEQALDRTGRSDDPVVHICHSGKLDDKKIRSKFFFFLQKQRTKHVFLLIGEAILLPLSGLMALLPGPNVFFGFLALIMITHWQALKGINGLLKKDQKFCASDMLGEWEEAVRNGKSEDYDRLLSRLEKKYSLTGLSKILWK